LHGHGNNVYKVLVAKLHWKEPMGDMVGKYENEF
jgi:hypothetical protein